MEPKIVLKHSRIEINNYEKGDSPNIEYIFSIWDPLTHKTYPSGIEYDEHNKKLYLPRGLDIPYIENTFSANALVDRKCDEYTKTNPIPIKYLTRDDSQLKTLKFTLGEGEYSYIKSKSQILIANSTGTGKTFITVANICFTGSRAIIITSSIEWLNQWKDRIMQYTPLKDEDIYMITGSPSIDKLYHRDPQKYQIFLASHSTLRSYGDKYGWDKIDALFKYLKCGLKVYDEAHLYFDNICKIDFHSNTHFTIYLTATPERSNKDENQIYKLYFKNIPSIDLFDPNKDPHTNYIAMHFNSHPGPYDIKSCKNAYGFDRNKYTNYVIKRPSFQLLLNSLIGLLYKIPGKVLIYIGTNAAIKYVYDYLINQFPFLENQIGVYTSITTENKIEQQHKKFILSTTKSAGTASDISELMVTVNLAEPFKSPVLTRQTLGRTRADNTLYIDVVDDGFYFTKKYYQAKKPIFSRYAKSCKDIFISDSELENKSDAVIKKYDNKNILCKRVFKE